MGGMCTSNIATLTDTITKKYGQESIIQYVQSKVGSNLLTQQFSGLKNTITQKFNSSGQASTSEGQSALSRVLSQITNAESEEKSKL